MIENKDDFCNNTF